MKARRFLLGLMLGLILSLGVLAVAMVGPATGKSMYVVANHHTRQFDAWNIEAPGIVPPITYQATYNLSHANDPADVAVWVDPTDPSEGILFITSEFDYGVEIVDAKTMTPLGWVMGGYGLAGIKIDYHTNIVYTVERMTNDLYEYDWDPVAKTLTLRAGYPVDLPNCDPYGAIGLALDDIHGLLYVADAVSGLVRVYDVTTLTEVSNFAPSIPPVGIAVDRRRGFVYTTHPDDYCADLPQYGAYTLLSKYDLATGVETRVDMGHGGMGIAVDEATGYVYVTGGCSGDDISIWDSALDSVYSTGPIGNPAGIAIGPGYNPLNLAKNDAVVGYGVYMGQTFTYEITCENTDSVFDKTGVTIVDDLPVELDFVSETVGGNPGTGMYNSAMHTVTWNIGTIPAGQPGPLVELVVRINQNAVPGGTIYNYCKIMSDQGDTSTVIGRDPDTTDGEGTYILPVGVELSISPNAVSVRPGETADYTLSVWNKGGNLDDYFLKLWGLPSNFAYSMSDTIQGVGGNDTAYVPLAITPPHDLAIWSDTPYPFTVACTSITYSEASNDTAQAVIVAQATPSSRVRFTDLLLDALIAQVESSNIPAGAKNSLLAKLDNAKKKKEQGLARLEAGDTTVAMNMFNAAANMLGAFINEVLAQSGKKIPVALANSFIAQAQDIIWRLRTGIWEGGSPPPPKLAGDDSQSPHGFELSQNYPNPFNPVTQIRYTLPTDGHIKLEIYNLLGQKVATLVDEYQQAGEKSVNWEAKDLSSGIYFYKLTAGDFTATKKMVLTK